MISPRDGHALDGVVFVLIPEVSSAPCFCHLGNTHFWIDHLHHRLLQAFQVDGVLCRRPRDHIVLVVRVSTKSGKLFGIGELDVDPVELHYPLDILSSNANDPLVITLRHVERHFCRELLLKH